MDELVKIFNDYNLNIISIDKKYINVEYSGVIITFNSHILFSMPNESAILFVKNQFSKKGLELTKSGNSKTNLNFYTKDEDDSIMEKKKNIRNIIKNKLIIKK